VAHLNYLLDQWWLGPAFGVVIGSIAFVAGRLLFRGTPKPGWTNPEPAAADPYNTAAPEDRRAGSRRGGNPVEVEILDADSGVAPIAGWVVDRSVGGLCLEIDRAVPVGTSVQVMLRNAATSIGPIPVAVKSCRAAGTAWRIGCQFLKTPTFNVMLLFG
jgi:hypothetical protein